MSKKILSQTGSSIVEILLVALVAGVIIVLLANLTPAANILNNSRRENIARQIVAKKIEDVRSQGYEALANGLNTFSDPRLTQLTQGSASTNIQDCPPTICTKGELIKQIDISVNWIENNTPKSFSISTLIAKGGLR